VPGAIFAVIGGVLFGPVWGSLWNLLGGTLGATLAFLVARYIVGDWVRHKAGGLIKRLIDGVDAEGWRFVAFVRLVPLFPFNLSNYVLGLTRIPLHQYIIATLVCMVPGAVAYTWLGHAGRGALTGEADTVRYGLLALGLLAAIALLPRLIGRMRRAFSWIEANELKRRLDSGETLTVIDVRGADEFTGPLGHIATARHIPVAELNGRLAEIAGLERTPIVLVCRTDKRSAAAARTLRAADFAQVSVLRRGMEQWNEAGLPVEGRAVEAAR
jgi:rhodanese-related sulfurtransferase/membrane protein DedA with SNARE-associated domain